MNQTRENSQAPQRNGAPPTAVQLKSAIQSRWALPERVEGWTTSGLNAEFADPACRQQWKEALCRAVAGTRLGAALDIGTGPGTIAQLWAELECDVTGIDFSPGMLEAARRQAADRGLTLRLIEGDAEDPPVTGKRFDIISSRFVLFTLPHPGYAVRRWVSLLRPGGSLVLIGHEHAERATPRPNRPPASTKAEKRHREVLTHLPFVNHDANDLRVVMEAAGLREIERQPLRELLRARAAYRKRRPDGGTPLSTPFILVGRK
jgi:ubiquinone/menaquinone biosynthesis C-methylase UbiE